MTRSPTADQNDIEIISPIPDYASDITKAARSRYGIPVAVWTYANASGQPVAHVARYATPDGKLILPWVWGKVSGREQWIMGMPPRPRPIYRLDRIVQSGPEVPILLVEGEKAADAGACLFPSWITTTVMGGAAGVGAADLSPLAGRTVVLHPDHDAAGWQWCVNMVSRLRQEGAGRIMMLRMPSEWRVEMDTLVSAPTEPDTGDDLADWWARDWRAEHLVELRKAGAPILWDISDIQSLAKAVASKTAGRNAKVATAR